MKAFPSRAALALTLACGLALAGTAGAATPAPDAAASQPADAVRPEFATIFNAAQDLLLKQGKAPDALAKIREAEALPNLSPYEQYLIVRVKAPAEYAANDYPASIADFEKLLPDSRLASADRAPLLRVLINMLVDQKQWAKAAQWFPQYFAAAGDDPRMRELQAEVLYRVPDYPAAAKALQAIIDAEAAAGHAPTEKQLRLLLSAQSQDGDDKGREATLERLAITYPKADVWREITSRAAASSTKLSDREYVDVYRLKTAAFDGTPDGERLSYAALAQRAGYPGEAKRVLEEGKAHDAFKGNDAAEANKLLAAVTKAAAADRQQAAANEASARSAKDGNALVGQGLLAAVDGDAAHGAQLIQQGIDKGGLKSVDDARLHLGYAQYLAGDYAAATRTFQAIAPTGNTGALAHAWVLLAQSKAQPHPAAAPAASAAAK
jgi:hypothetical protein